jgi:membrane protein
MDRKPGFIQAIKTGGQLLQRAFKELNANDPLRLAAATAFFTTFALPAILIILIQLLGLILNRRTIGQHIFQDLGDVIGVNTALQLRQTLRNVRHLVHTWYIATGVFVFLIFVATTLFKVIKDSLNQLWSIKVKEKRSIRFKLRDRAKSFLAVLLAGILFLAGLLAEGLLAILQKYISLVLQEDELVLNIINQLLSLLVVTTWFAMVFKYLPDGRTTWRVTITGAFFTGLLFTAGKLLLRVLLSYSNMQTIYGASTSTVLLLLFVFYASFIFYYGACFTNVWAQYKQQPILPGKNAIKYKWLQVDLEKQ